MNNPVVPIIIIVMIILILIIILVSYLWRILHIDCTLAWVTPGVALVTIRQSPIINLSLNCMIFLCISFVFWLSLLLPLLISLLLLLILVLWLAVLENLSRLVIIFNSIWEHSEANAKSSENINSSIKWSDSIEASSLYSVRDSVRITTRILILITS